MFGADAKASFANYFQKNKIQFSQCTFSFILDLTNYFGLCYKVSNFLAIIDRYYNWLSSDGTI